MQDKDDRQRPESRDRKRIEQKQSKTGSHGQALQAIRAVWRETAPRVPPANVREGAKFSVKGNELYLSD